MQTVDLIPGSVTTTRLGLGCASLMQLASKRKRQDILATAYEAGIRHFDVARMYGLGAAEREVGSFARGRRDRLVIATKFGIEASPPGWVSRVQTPARALLARSPTLRGAVKRREGLFRQPRCFDAASARQSLEHSLSELETDYIDILFVHDPLDEKDVAGDDLRSFLDDCLQEGTIRAWGVSGERDIVSALAPSLPATAVLQVRDDIFTRRAHPVPNSRPRITFGVLSSALELIVLHVRASEEVRDHWYRTLGLDCSIPEVVASLLLRDALHANATGVVLQGTTKPDRVRAAAIAAQFDSNHDQVLSAFQRLVLAEFASTGVEDPG